VRKTLWDGVSRIARAGGEDRPFVFSGTLPSQGNGIARVMATDGYGNREIGKALQSVETEETLLQKETGGLSAQWLFSAYSLCSGGSGPTGLTGDWLHGLLAGITLAMAMLPEEFPVVY